jgi:nucleoid-associated protein YgaU
MFFKGSRYEKVATDRITNDQGQVVLFKKVRFIPATPASAALVVGQGELLDQIAHRVYQDPELFWLICDANRALWPDDLVAEPGRAILIPPSEG